MTDEVREMIEAEKAMEKSDLIPMEQIKEQYAQEKELQTVGTSTHNIVGDVKYDILSGARKRLDNEKTKEKHSKKLASVADKAIETEIEIERLKVEQQKADNVIEKKRIKNEMFILRQEHKRAKKEQQELNAMQKIAHRQGRKQKKWETYGSSLEQLGYDYVPNPIVLAIVLFLVGARAFFNGLSKMGDAMVKALKWLFIVGAVLVIIMTVPVTREWFLALLGYK